MTGWIDRDDDLVQRTAPELVWHLAEQAPELAEAVLEAMPALAEPLEGLRFRVPVPRRRFPDAPPFVRFAGHGRSFCVGLGDPPGTKGHLVFKGSEHMTEDYEAWLDEQAGRWLRIAARQETHFHADGGVEAEMRLLDKWAVLEGKVPGAYTLDEALGEAGAATELQSAFAETYGEAARAPLPLLAYRWAEECVDRVRNALRPRLSPGAWAMAARGLEGGLGLYVYYYAGTPLRLAHLGIGDAESLGISSRLEQLAADVDWREAAEGWLDLTAKMIAVGFLPKSPASVVRGDCLQFQNVILDGGLADLDSLIHVDKVPTERELRDILRRTVIELTKSIATLLLGAPAQDASFLRRFPDIAGYVGGELMTRLARAEATTGLHPRVAAVVRPAAWLDRIEEALRQAF